VAEESFEYQTWPPAPPLSNLIERYLGYRIVGYPPGVHRGLPSRHMTLIVSIGDPIDVVAQTDPHQAPDRYRVVVGGLQASPALIAHDGNQEGVESELTPVGCRTLLGLPARELWNLSIELDDVIGGVGRELWERLQGVVGWEARFAVCDEVLGRLVTQQAVAPELRRSWEALVATGGTVTIADLARDIGWSRQHLARRFGDEFGLGPRLAGRVMRFERARRMLTSTPSFVSIAQVAAACGYYDQAHLTHDFVDLAGCPPTMLLAEELPTFQDDEVVLGAR
jgi:AraC-like DNA-binding protein